MPDSWAELTVDDLLTALNAAESTAYRTKLLDVDQDDPAPEILQQVVHEVRGAVRSCRHNSLDEDPATLPVSCKHHAIAIARYRLLTRFVGDVSDPREEEWRAANRFLEKVASCSFLIEPPGEDDGDKAPLPAGPKFSSPTLTQTRAKADGA